MKKRIITWLTAACLFLPVCTSQWFADTFVLSAEAATVASGTCGNNLTWILDNSQTLTISGNGEMDEYWVKNDTSAPWRDYRDQIKKVKIGSGVTVIGEHAFYGCTLLETVELVKGLKEIDYGAFYGCSALKKVDFPSTFETIGMYAFRDCTNLEEITVPDGLKVIDNGAFRDCWVLKNFRIPDGITVIEDYTFNNCKSLEKLVLPDSIEYIGAFVFEGCSSLSSINIPEGIPSIEAYTFCDCANLRSLELPDSIESIGYYAFSGCVNLTSIRMPVKLDRLGFNAFYNCVALKSITVPKGITKIEDNVFRGCSDLETVVLPNGLEEIGFCGFNSCMALKSITIPETVMSIGDYAFARCVRLEEISLPTQMENLGIYALQGCHSLKSIVIPSGITHIADNMFEYGNELKSVVIPNTVVSIGNAVFKDCVKLDKVVFKGNAPAISENAFWNVKANVSIPKGDTTWTNNKKQNYNGILAWSADPASPKITRQPVPVSSVEGAYAQVSLSAEGHGLTYEWYYWNKGDTKLYMTTSFKENTYKIQMNDSRNGRRVFCKITDSSGNSVMSDVVSLNMKEPEPVKITQHPLSVTVAEGATAKVTVKATGDGLTYRWYYKDAGKSSYTFTSSFKSNTYSVQMNAARNGRRVLCRVYDKYGNTVQSSSALLSMKKADPVKITVQPKSVTVKEGVTAKVTLTATGEGLTYKWYFKDAGASKFSYTSSFKGSSYSVQMNSARAGRQVYCVISDKHGNSVTTNTVTLNMEAEKNTVKIVTQPKSVTVADGATAKVTVKATGDGLTYRWYYKDAGKSSYTYTSSFKGNSYSVTMNSARNGRRVLCKVYDKYGNMVQSSSALLKMK